MSSRIRVFLILSGALLGFASASQAAPIVLNATDSGWHSSYGDHLLDEEAYTVGWVTDRELRNFFVFDLSGLPAGETILSATLRAYNPADDEPDPSFDGGYQSGDPSETYELREVLATSAVVTTPTVGTGTPTAVYNDLGDGTAFGNTTASLADNGQNILVNLNAAGIAQLQTFAGVGDVVLGGVLTSLASAIGTEETIWALTDPPNGNQGSPYDRQLVLQITPEPSTGLLLAFGLLAIATRRRVRA